MLTVEELLAIEEIKQLKARYFRFTDTKQWEALRDVFTPDAVIDGGRRYASLDDFIADRVRLDPAVTTHHGHTPEIVFLSESRARGLWPMYDHVEYSEPFTEPVYRGVDTRQHDVRGFAGTGFYEEEYRRDDGVWRISRLRLTRLRLVAIGSPRPPALEITAPSHGTGWLRGEG
jgi:hypothetical protein